MPTIRLPAAALLAAILCAGLPLLARADDAPPAPPQPDVVVAKVNGAEIHLSDVQEAMAALPEEYRSLPKQMLLPMLVDQLIDRKAVVLLAEKQGLEKDPAVQRQIARATDSALQNAVFQHEIGPLITEQAIKARYDATVAGKPGEEEVHARHILVASEDEAKKIIVALDKGGDFAALAKQHSTDSGAAQGGDLGFFKKSDMVPEFAAAAFALKDGEYTKTPVHTQYGWHIIMVIEHRQAPPPTYEQARDQIRQDIIQEGVKKVVAEAKQGLTIVKYNPDGSTPKATDTAEPPPAKQ